MLIRILDIIEFLKFGIKYFLFFVFFYSFGYAQSGVPHSLVLEVNPSSFGVNESVDMTIKVIDSNQNTVTNYVGDIYMEINIIDPSDYVLPSDGFYTFLEQDQGVKLFSKGLNIKVPGTYKVEIYDIFDNDVAGQATVIVGQSQDSQSYSISLISPVSGGIESKDNIDVIAQASDLPNSKFQVLLNDVVRFEGISTEKGDISAYVSGASNGQNTLQVRVVNVNGISLGQSPLVIFNYQKSSDNIFKNIKLLPSNNVKVGDRLTFNVEVEDSVTSAELRFSDGTYTPLDFLSAGSFSKTINVQNKGSIYVTLSLIAGGNRKIYDNVATFNVEDNNAIGNIKFYTDDVDKTSVNVVRDKVGIANKYRIQYGNLPTNLSFSQDVVVNEIKLSNLNPEQKYYIKISILDVSGNVVGTPSNIEEIVPGHLGPPSAGNNTEPPTCVVRGLNIWTGMVGDKHYVMRDSIQNVEKYIIYRSERDTKDIANMKKVGETTDNKFEYRYDNDSKSYLYAYYTVYAICSDGNSLQIGDVKKVNVGPVDNIIFFISFVLFFYTIYRLYFYIRH